VALRRENPIHNCSKYTGETVKKVKVDRVHQNSDQRSIAIEGRVSRR